MARLSSSGVRSEYQPVLSSSLEADLHLGMAQCDATVLTGEGTGMETSLEKIQQFRSVLGDYPLIVGAGGDSVSRFYSLHVGLAEALEVLP